VWRAGTSISRKDVTAPEGSDPEAATADTLAASDDPLDAAPDAAAAPEVPQPGPRPTTRRRRGDPSERGLRDLVGSGPSQLGPVKAMRARDLNRPTDEDLADAQENVVLVRRHWKPPKP
jgi:hypothetical protein